MTARSPKTAANVEPKATDEPSLSETGPVDEATLIEERRKRREAIKAKYRGSATPLLVQSLQLGNGSGPSTPGAEVSDSTNARKSGLCLVLRGRDPY